MKGTLLKDSKYTSTGFSMVELMVVIAIMGLILTISGPKYQLFIGKARQAEAKANLKLIITLQEGYKAEYGCYWLGIFSSGDTSSQTSCHMPNGVGFKVDDCTKARYWYQSFVMPGSTNGQPFTFDRCKPATLPGGGTSYVSMNLPATLAREIATSTSEKDRKVFPTCKTTLPLSYDTHAKTYTGFSLDILLGVPTYNVIWNNTFSTGPKSILNFGDNTKFYADCT